MPIHTGTFLARKRQLLVFLVPALLIAAPLVGAEPPPDILISDFEGVDYGVWKATGEAFGAGPARGTLPGQMDVSGFKGKGLVNSFHQGDVTTGTLTSPEFTVSRNFISFLIGGGGWEGKTCVNLLVDGRIVRLAIGPNTEPGGSEALAQASWDVHEFKRKTAVIEIVDRATGGWGHINVDHILQTDNRPAALVMNATREFVAEKRLLHFPVKTGAPKRKVKVLMDGRVERFFDIELADAKPDWWAPLEIAAWKGRRLTIQVDRLSEDSRALTLLAQSDDLKDAENLYHERLRPQFHFSPQRGWNNDPNGLVFYRGEYHLFFQHNPYGWNWGNMHWGHAVSRDLVHWQELGDKLAPDDMGPMFSGSAVVDWQNTSGLGRAGGPPLVLIYTAAGNPTVQCLASSTDGRNFTKFGGNPVVKQITEGNRDPKVYWYSPRGIGARGTELAADGVIPRGEPTKHWVMALYVEKDKRHTIHFLTSSNLKDWTVVSQIEGFYECPDFFELPVDGNAANKKWVLTAANSDYMIGSFDGETFTAETAKLKGQLGRGFYAAQTFSDLPPTDGRRVQIGWLQAPTPGMPFNQAMSLPLELKLASTDGGPRLTWTPVKELESLRARSHRFGPLTLKAGDRNPLTALNGELLELRAEFEPSTASVLNLKVRGMAISYDAGKQELTVNGQRAPAPLRYGRQQLIVYADRTALEVFASDGLTYVPMPVIADKKNLTVEISVTGDEVKFSRLEGHSLRSIWK